MIFSIIICKLEMMLLFSDTVLCVFLNYCILEIIIETMLHASWSNTKAAFLSSSKLKLEKMQLLNCVHPRRTTIITRCTRIVATSCGVRRAARHTVPKNHDACHFSAVLSTIEKIISNQLNNAFIQCYSCKTTI